jgi:AraC-like DNA-binding protein/mannose-6-phosphate isomerase-like protein (cupin superfamily)
VEIERFPRNDQSVRFGDALVEHTYQRRPVDVTLPSHGVFVLESHHAPDFRMTAQCHDFLEVFYVLKGTGVFRIDGQRYPARHGDILIVPVGRVHVIEDDPAEPLALYGICIAPEVWRHEPTLLDHLPSGRLPASKLLAARVRADLRQLLFEQTLARPGRCTLSLGLALQLVARLARSFLDADSSSSASGPSNSDHRQAVARYVADLSHRFFEDTDLDHVAAELGMSRRRFTHLFRQAAGASWSAHLTRLRIDYACQLLRESSRSILAIAFETGYEDLSSFYRSFKREKGLPPRAWRERHAVRKSPRPVDRIK